MKPNATFLACFLALGQVPIHAQTTLPYATGFDDPAGQEGWHLIRKGVASTGAWSYEAGGAPSAPNFLWHDHVLNDVATDTTCDWFVSPAFDFIEGAWISSLKIAVNSISGVITPADGLAVYLLVGSDDPAQASAVVLLCDLTPLVDGTPGWVEGPHPMILPRAGACHLAIKYQATTNPFTVSIDDIAVQAPVTGVHGLPPADPDVQLYPNPSKGTIALSARTPSGPLRLRLFDARGAVVMDRLVSANEPVQLAFGAGLYGYAITDGGDRALRKGTLVLER
ncbi:MAG: T9SS type A sorting domain-containing protein [Bacteroidetes bacterium]|nr:T9SS type A sorting domain-containing protein [Bacteroidota bacterium]